jgi:hypothetical protein
MIDTIQGILAVLSSFLLVLSALIALWLKWRKSKKEVQELNADKEVLNAQNKKLKKKFLSSSMKIDLADLNEIKIIVEDVFQKTAIDRFLLLSAVNGKEDFNFVSALYEQHEGRDECLLSIGATSKYIDIETDDSYKEMFKIVEKLHPLILDVQKMRDCILKRFYFSEKVLHSGVLFLSRKSLDESNDRLLIVSWATHVDTPIEETTKLIIQGATNRMKPYFK